MAVAQRLPPPSLSGVHPRSGVGARPPPATGRQSDGYGAPPRRKERTRVGTDPPPGPVAPHRQVLCALLCGVGRGVGRTAPRRADKPPHARRPVPRPIRAPRWADRRAAATNRVRGRTGDDTSLFAWACVGGWGGVRVGGGGLQGPPPPRPTRHHTPPAAGRACKVTDRRPRDDARGRRGCFPALPPPTTGTSSPSIVSLLARAHTAVVLAAADARTVTACVRIADGPVRRGWERGRGRRRDAAAATRRSFPFALPSAHPPPPPPLPFGCRHRAAAAWGRASSSPRWRSLP